MSQDRPPDGPSDTPGDPDGDEVLEYGLDDFDDDPADFTQSKGWRLAVYGVSAVVLLALLLPALLFACNSSGPAAAAAPPPPTSGLPATAPDFELEAAGGATVRLYDLFEANEAVVIVFYRGYF